MSDELWEDVRTVAEQAVDAFVAMRAVEGEDEAMLQAA